MVGISSTYYISSRLNSFRDHHRRIYIIYYFTRCCNLIVPRQYWFIITNQQEINFETYRSLLNIFFSSLWCYVKKLRDPFLHDVVITNNIIIPTLSWRRSSWYVNSPGKPQKGYRSIVYMAAVKRGLKYLL